MDDSFGPNFITVTDEEGNDFELEMVDSLEHNGITYYAMFPAVEEDEATGQPKDVDADDEEYGLVIMKAIQENGEELLSTLPEGFSGENTVAAIRIRNNQLYVSNRGHDSIAVFAIREAGGLALRQIIPTGGRIPRDFAIMGEYMVIANQGSDDITVLRIASGRLEQTDISVPMSRPACICPVPASLRDKIP